MRAATEHSQPSLFPPDDLRPSYASLEDLLAELSSFDRFGTRTQVGALVQGDHTTSVFLNEFWTSKQRAASSLHEISYRACFKPQLPRFFIERLTQPGAVVYDPFLGRGTSVIEAALLGRNVIGCDVNPLSSILAKPRLCPPAVNAVRKRLAELDWNYGGEIDEDLQAFYHPDTLRELYALREHLLTHDEQGSDVEVDGWIRMVATNRLTGHSAGFFSVYTLPPNQAVSLVRQRRINQLRDQTPPKRSVPGLIARKTNTLLHTVTESDRDQLKKASTRAVFITGSCESTPRLKKRSVDLIVTSPPFLDVVDYAGDNWLRCWFNGIDETKIGIWGFREPERWAAQMTTVFRELARVLRDEGYIAFEVGEVRRGKLKMEELVIPAAREAGLRAVFVLINSQVFTKTSNCWGVTNNDRGTNTNRVVVFKKA